MTVQDALAKWEQLYKNVMGMEVDFSTLIVPPQPEGDHWPIVVVPNITYNHVVTGLRKLFPVWTWTYDLDKIIDITKEQRADKKDPYIVWVKATQEADPDNAGKSAVDLVGTNQITLKERLLLEGFYFQETGRHLDNVNITLCAGSRYLDGRVPHGFWYGSDDGLCVGYCYPHPVSRDGRLRSRSVFC